MLKFKQFFGKIEIYCDLDGVLVDFENGIRKFIPDFDEQIIFKDQRLFSELMEQQKSFWKDLSWESDGKDLWNTIKYFKPQILTAAPFQRNHPLFDEVVKQKTDWCNKHLDSFGKIHVVPRNEKKDFAKPNRILIDDLQKNINEWKSNEGIGILHTSAKSSIEAFEIVLENFHV